MARIKRGKKETEVSGGPEGAKRITRAWRGMSLPWQLKVAGFNYRIIC